jgi:hypothetical protein
MANRKATFAKRQRETDLKDRAKQKEDRRSQKRGEVRESKGPQIAWDEAVHAVTSSEDLPPLGAGNKGDGGDLDADDAAEAPPSSVSVSPAPSGAASPPVAPSAPVPAPVTPSRPTSTSTSAKPGPAGKPATSPSPAAPRRVG